MRGGDPSSLRGIRCAVSRGRGGRFLLVVLRRVKMNQRGADPPRCVLSKVMDEEGSTPRHVVLKESDEEGWPLLVVSRCVEMNQRGSFPPRCVVKRG